MCMALISKPQKFDSASEEDRLAYSSSSFGCFLVSCELGCLLLYVHKLCAVMDIWLLLFERCLQANFGILLRRWMNDWAPIIHLETKFLVYVQYSLNIVSHLANRIALCTSRTVLGMRHATAGNKGWHSRPSSQLLVFVNPQNFVIRVTSLAVFIRSCMIRSGKSIFVRMLYALDYLHCTSRSGTTKASYGILWVLSRPGATRCVDLQLTLPLSREL